MEQRNRSIILREVLGGASLILLIAAGVSICTAGGAFGLTADGVGAPAAASVTIDDTSFGGNLDVPAPAADYDIPADARPVAGPDPDSQAVVNADNVLELPQVVELVQLRPRRARQH
jgi:hypothetical protein